MEIRHLSQPSALRSSFAVLSDWLLIGLAFAFAIFFPGPLIWIFCLLLVARQQLALAILMHDGAHRRLFKSVRLNDFVSQFFCAAPLFFSMYSYQKLHLKHHRNPLAQDDPDLSLIGGYPISRLSLLRKIARDASGISYFKFIRYFVYMARRPQAQSATGVGEGRSPAARNAGAALSLPMIVFSMLLVNFTIWLPLYLLGHGWFYLFLWVLPAVTVLQVLLRIRGIAEHAGYEANTDQRLNARTVLSSWQTLIFAPHNVNYHIEHHVYPAVPFYNLPKLHRLFVDKEILPKGNIYSGYGVILRELTTQKR